MVVHNRMDGDMKRIVKIEEEEEEEEEEKKESLVLVRFLCK